MIYNGAGVQITYGAYDLEHCTENIEFLYLSTIGYWQFAAKLRVRLEQTTYENRVEISSDTGMASIMILRRL